MNLKIISQSEKKTDQKNKNKNPTCTILLHVYKIQENKKNAILSIVTENSSLVVWGQRVEGWEGTGQRT